MLFGSCGLCDRRAATWYPGRNAAAALCVSLRYRARKWNSYGGGWGYRRSCPPVDLVAADHFNCEGRSIVEVGTFQVDPRKFPRITEVCLAGGVRSLLSRSFAKSDDGQIHPGSSRTP